MGMIPENALSKTHRVAGRRIYRVDNLISATNKLQ
jgi:hypothetical protein